MLYQEIIGIDKNRWVGKQVVDPLLGPSLINPPIWKLQISRNICTPTTYSSFLAI